MSELSRRWMETLGSDVAPGANPLRARLVDEGGAVDGPSVLAAASRLGELLERRTQRGDRVLIDAPRGLPWLAAFLACVTRGRVAVPLAEGCPAPEIAAQAERAAARHGLVATTSTTSFPAGVEVIAFEAADLRRGDRTSGPPPELDPGDDEAALFLFTSGTTGRPKAAILTHANLLAQTRAVCAAWRIDPGDVLLHALPLHHTHGVVVGLLSALGAGARVEVLPRFDPRAVWEGLARATIWMGVPTMYAKLLEVFDAAPPDVRSRWATAARSLRLATSGSAALPVSLGARWRALAGSLPLERYGMTEIGMALGNPLDPAGRRAGAVGAPFPTVEARLVDERGGDAREGPGELWIRGPSVFAGYFAQPEETAASFAEGGWFRTGDVAVIEAGSFRLLGRRSVDILKSGGEKVSALEIEEVLRELEGIAEVAVIGVPDAVWGDRVVAVVVVAEGHASACTPESVRAFAKARLPPFKVPKDVVITAALPRNAMGKVQKQVLVERLDTKP